MSQVETTVRAVYDAIESNDAAALAELIDEKVTYVVPGANRFAGVHEGRDEYFAVFGELVALTGGTLRLTPEAMFFAADRAVVVQRTTAQRDDANYNLVDALVIDVEDGRVTTVTECPADAVAFDLFLA